MLSSAVLGAEVAPPKQAIHWGIGSGVIEHTSEFDGDTSSSFSFQLGYRRELARHLHWEAQALYLQGGAIDWMFDWLVPERVEPSYVGAGTGLMLYWPHDHLAQLTLRGGVQLGELTEKIRYQGDTQETSSSWHGGYYGAAGIRLAPTRKFSFGLEYQHYALSSRYDAEAVMLNFSHRW